MNFTVQDLAQLSHLTRWQNVPTIQRESVAEHTCQVALIVMLLRDEYEFDLDRAIRIALLHDLCETELSDLPHNVTRRFPQLAKAKANAEAEVVAERMPEYQELLSTHCLEHDIVKLSDTLQVVQFASSELALSSTNTRMQTVLDEAQALADAMRVILEPYLLKP